MFIINGYWPKSALVHALVCVFLWMCSTSKSTSWIGWITPSKIWTQFRLLTLFPEFPSKCIKRPYRLFLSVLGQSVSLSLSHSSLLSSPFSSTLTVSSRTLRSTLTPRSILLHIQAWNSPTDRRVLSTTGNPLQLVIPNRCIFTSPLQTQPNSIT